MLPCYPGLSFSEWQSVKQNEKQKLPLWLNDCTLGRGSRGRGPVTDYIYFVSVWEFHIYVKFSNWDNIKTVQSQFRRQRRDETKHRIDQETQQNHRQNVFFCDHFLRFSMPSRTPWTHSFKIDLSSLSRHFAFSRNYCNLSLFLTTMTNEEWYPTIFLP